MDKNSEIRDAGQAGTKEPALQFVRDLYEYFQGPHACGDFTCACGDVKSCGICEMRVRTEKFLAEVPVSAPVPSGMNELPGVVGKVKSVVIDEEVAVSSHVKATGLCLCGHSQAEHGRFECNWSHCLCESFRAAPVPEPEPTCRGCGKSEDDHTNEETCFEPEPPARKDELGTCQYHGHTGFKHEHRLICIDWTSVAPQASPEASKEMVILRPCKCGHGWESHEPERCNESGCRCEDFRPEASPEAPTKEDTLERDAFKVFIADQDHDEVPTVLAWRAWEARARLGLSGRAE